MGTGLDIESPEALLAYLRGAGRLGPREPAEVRVLAGGVSNRTVRVRRANGTAWVLKQALGKLRVAVEWLSDPARIHREALGLRHLADLLPAGSVPQFVFEDIEHQVLAMTAVPEPHANWKAELLAGRIEAELVGQCGRLLGALHREGAARAASLEPVFADRTFFESLRLEPYYGFAASRNPEAAGFLEALIRETRANARTLVHGDFSPKNLLVQAGRLVLLDHEVIHWGDPAFDVGFVLTHFLSKANHLPPLRAAFAAAAGSLWRGYAGTADRLAAEPGFEPRAVRQTLGCLLARVDGRSPLEYLDPEARRRQRRAALRLLDSPPSTVPELISAHVSCLSSPD